MPSPEYKLTTNNADKGKQNEGVTLNSQKSHVESNMSVVDLSHLVNSENTALNNNAHTSNEYLISLPTQNKEAPRRIQSNSNQQPNLNSCSSSHEISVVNNNNGNTKEVHQFYDDRSQIEQNSCPPLGSSNYQHIPTRITDRKHQSNSRKLNANRNYLNSQRNRYWPRKNEIGKQNKSTKPGTVKAKKCDKIGAQGFRITSNMKDQANWYRYYY